MTSLRKQIAAYDAMRNDLELDYFGKWVVFYNEELAGTYDTLEAAAEDAVSRFGRGPYLIRKVGQAPLRLPASILYSQAVQRQGLPTAE